MATIRYRLHSKSNNAPIYLKLSISRKLRFERRTGLFINPSDWSNATSLPKQNNPDNKNLTTKLRELENFLQIQLNQAFSNGIEINSKWLELKIDVFFNRVTESDQSEYLLDAIQHIIDTANVRTNGKGGIGLSKSRINSYKQLKKKIEVFDKNQRTKVKHVNKSYAQNFLSHLINDCHYAKSYAQKKIDDLKTVCYDAEINGVEVSPQLKRIESGKVKNEYVIYLTPEEIEKIERAEIINSSLDNARKWLLLGCHIGQRGNDLLKLTHTNFVTRGNIEVIELIQEKTKKPVTIPILPKTKQILENGLPYKISLQRFNEYIKKVCKIAEIDQVIDGSKKDPKTNRNVIGKYPKYELIGSHVCRRTFATNNYGILPTPLIMQITRHSTEKMFLTYIGKNSYDYAKQIDEFYKLQELKQIKKPQLKIVDKASNN